MKLSYFSVVDHYADGPRERSQLYAEVVDQAVLAEQLGFEAVWFAEHHFVDYGIVPNPAVLLSHIAARTRRVRLGPAISVLPFRDPRLAAEDYAMLDQLSGGRVVLGIGSGYVAPEYAGFGLDFADKHQRYGEALDALRRLLAGERVSLEGQFVRMKDVRLNVLPRQRPLPIAVATGQLPTVPVIARQGDALLFMIYSMCNHVDEAAAAVSSFRAARAAAGMDPAGRTVSAGIHTHVGETDADARHSVQAAFDLYSSTRVKARKRSYEEGVDTGVVMFGSPERVADQLVKLARMGIDEVLTLHNFGLLDDQAVRASMTRLMTEVMPIVRARLAARAPAAALAG